MCLDGKIKTLRLKHGLERKNVQKRSFRGAESSSQGAEFINNKEDAPSGRGLGGKDHRR